MVTKTCDNCKEKLPTIAFGKNRFKPDGLQSICKTCKKDIDKKYHECNKDKIKTKKREYYLKNKAYIVKKSSNYSVANREKCRVWSTRAKNKLKAEVFARYCNGDVKCTCGQDNIDLLTIDHVNGGGNKHRKEMGIKTAGYAFYRWLYKNSYPEGFQVLCWNCNFKKRLQEMAPKNPDKRQLQKAAYARSVKVQCLDQYGKTCPCGEQDKDVLTLDHVNDDGADHRRETNTRGLNFYIYLRKNGFPSNPPLKVLCLNCQYKKRNDNEAGKGGQAVDYQGAAVVVQRV